VVAAADSGGAARVSTDALVNASAATRVVQRKRPFGRARRVVKDRESLDIASHRSTRPRQNSTHLTTAGSSDDAPASTHLAHALDCASASTRSRRGSIRLAQQE